MKDATRKQSQALRKRSPSQTPRRKSEQTYEKLFGAARDVIFTISLEGKLTSCNPAFEQITGWECREWIGRSFAGLVHPDDLPGAMLLFKNVLQGENLPSHEWRILHRDGHYLVGDFITTRQEIDGEIVGILGIARDVTQRKEALQALRYQAELLDLAHDAIIVRDEHSIIRFWNRGAEEMYGWTKAEVMGKTTHEVIRTEFPQPLPDIEQAVYTRGRWEGELVHTRRDGTRLVVASRWALRVSEDAKERSILEINNDITSQKRAEAALLKAHDELEQRVHERTDELLTENRERTRAESEAQAAHQRVAEILESISDAFYALDREFRFTYVNRQAEYLWNKRREHIIGESVLDVFPQFRGSRTYELFCQVAREHQPAHTEEHSPILNRWLDISIYPGAAGITVYFRDITERKHRDEQLRSSLREKEALLKEIHHRVKNNMQVIGSLLRLQSRSVMDKQNLALFREAENRIKSMALVHEKLYQTNSFAQIDFGQYIRNLATNILRSMESNHVRIQLNLQVEDVSLNIDTAVPCGLILNELITNAVKHAFPEQEAEGEICVGFSRRPNGEYQLSVSDNGKGISQDLDLGDNRKLGLQLVQMLADELDGTVQLRSDKGVRVEVTFREMQYKERTEFIAG